MSIPEYKFVPQDIIDRTTVVLGGTGCGKTVLIKDLLHVIRPYIPIGTVFSGTDFTNKEYSGHLLPSALIHDRLDIEVMNNILERQKAFSQLYREYESKFEPLIQRCSDNRYFETKKYIISARDKKIAEARAMNAPPAAVAAEIDSINKRCVLEIERLRRMHMILNKKKLLSMNLSKDDHAAAKNGDLNHRCFIIIDDLTEELKAASRQKEFNQILNKGRHYGITFIIISHAITNLDASIRGSIYINVFGDSAAVSKHIDVLKLTGESKRRMQTHARYTFGKSKYHKLVYFKDSDIYKWTLANVHENYEYLAHNINDKIKSNQANLADIQKNNKYAKMLQ